MAKAVQRAMREEAMSFRASVSLASINPIDFEHEDAAKDFDDLPEPSGHRE